MKNSFLSISEAERLIEENGFSKIAPEKVSYIKDFHFSIDHIKNIIDKLFSANHMSEQKRTVLKCIGFFGTGGISANVFAELCQLKTKDIFFELASGGWITIDNHMLSMHPVMIETVCGWNVTNLFQKTVYSIMLELKKKLFTDKDSFLEISEAFLTSCKGHPELVSLPTYQELLFATVLFIPRHREEYILSHSRSLICHSDGLNREAVIKLYDLISEIYEERKELDKAYESLMKAQAFVDRWKDHHLKGQFFYLLVGYYDCKLDGWYTPRNQKEAKTLALLLRTLDKAIFHMKKSHHPEGTKLLVEYLRCKANILIRSKPEKKIRITRLLNKVETTIKEEKQEDSELGSGYYLTCAWYYTYVNQDIKKVSDYINLAYETQMQICESDLDLIDNLFVPAANIFLENGQEKEAEKWLLLGVKICEENEEIIPFARKKKELDTYLLDVSRYTKKEEE